MSPKEYSHTPVLLKEVLGLLGPKPGQNFIDATLGGGGYSRQLIEKIRPAGKLLSIDLDAEAIKAAEDESLNIKDQNWILVHGNFAQIDRIVRNHNFPPPDGIVADLGLSSFQLDQSGRGISFQKKEPLDMRFDQTSNQPDAKFILNNDNERRLVDIFEKYGEEKFSYQIARKILQARSEGFQIKYTTDLYQLIGEALPKPVKHKTDDSARRIFQALRIEVNHELENLETFLPRAFDLLATGGRLVVVSFHSLEDRIVKQFFVGLSKGCVCPPDFPQCVCGKNPQGIILTKKPIMASEAEIRENSRAKPAKLRSIKKL